MTKPLEHFPAGIGRQLRAARLRRGLSHQTLAEKIGVTRMTIYNWEMGKSEPHFSQLTRLQAVLGPFGHTSEESSYGSVGA